MIMMILIVIVFLGPFIHMAQREAREEGKKRVNGSKNIGRQVEKMNKKNKVSKKAE